ncbi:hypothetical protein B4Q13_20825 [Lacticaseibacillus rhamnosus]
MARPPHLDTLQAQHAPGPFEGHDLVAHTLTAERPARGAGRRIQADEKPKGGIIIPDTAKEKPQEGEVVAVGPGGRDESGTLARLRAPRKERFGQDACVRSFP